jgi:hypothetical protein
MNKAQIEMKIQMLEKELTYLKSRPMNCTTCENHSAGFCKHWGEKVPADVIPAGCDEWLDDCVPF